MILDSDGNPITAATPAETDANEDPSSSPTPSVEDPSSSEDHGRKPNAEKRIGNLVGERDYWKNRATAAETVVPSPASAPAPATPDLDPNDFNSDAEYLKARADAAEAAIETRLEAKFEAKLGAATPDKGLEEAKANIDKTRAKHEDFDAVAFNDAVPITQEMYDAAQGEDLGDILYALGSDIQESARIAALSPVQQIKAIGQIEARLNSKPKAPVPPPNPPTMISGNSATVVTPDADLSRKDMFAKWEAERVEGIKNG